MRDLRIRLVARPARARPARPRSSMSCMTITVSRDRRRLEQVLHVAADALRRVVAVDEHEVDVLSGLGELGEQLAAAARGCRRCGGSLRGGPGSGSWGSTRSNEWTSSAVRGDPGQAASLRRADLDRESRLRAGTAVPRARRARRTTSASRGPGGSESGRVVWGVGRLASGPAQASQCPDGKRGLVAQEVERWSATVHGERQRDGPAAGSSKSTVICDPRFADDRARSYSDPATSEVAPWRAGLMPRLIVDQDASGWARAARRPAARAGPCRWTPTWSTGARATAAFRASKAR